MAFTVLARRLEVRGFCHGRVAFNHKEPCAVKRAGIIDGVFLTARSRHGGPRHFAGFISLCHRRVESKEVESISMNSHRTIIAILATLSASLALADDFKTMDGKEYKDATVSRVEPDGIVVKTKSGISKLYFVQLPKEVQQRFHYDPQTASAYSAQQAAQCEVYQKQQEAARYRQEDADAQKRANIAARADFGKRA